MTARLDVLRHEVLNHVEVRGSKIPGDQILYEAPNIFGITIAVIFPTYKNVGPQYETCFMSPFRRPKFDFFFFKFVHSWLVAIPVRLLFRQMEKDLATLVQVAVDPPCTECSVRMPLVGPVRKACDIPFKGIAHAFLC